MGIYNNQFYHNRHENTLYSAETILSIVQEIIPNIDSAVDFGCGVGSWLSVLEKRGATKVCGIDGNWVNKDYLKIKKDDYIQHDFSQDSNLNIDQVFDLAISLEVAEHLPSTSANNFVSSLTNSSDFILFSAAIPYQGGNGHINEQWLDYWIVQFDQNEYVPFDIIRKRIWNNESIPIWYRQNTLLFVQKDRIKDLTIKNLPTDHIPPEVYSLAYKRAISPGIKKSLNGLFMASKNRIKQIFKC